jgi:TnpA family transposase
MLDMLSWHVPYLGWTRLPAEISEFEITHFFSLRPEERSAVLTRYRDSLRLGAALQIGFLKMCGRPLDAIQRVPADLLKHLGEQIEIAAPTIATLRALYLKRRRTLYEHQRWAMDLLGVIRFEPTDTEKLLPSLCDVARAGVSGDHLLTATRKLLYEARFVIPGTRRLSNLMQAAVSRVEHDASSMIERMIPVRIRNQWLDALSAPADPERRMALLEYLQEPPAKFSPSTIERQSGKVTELRNLGVDTDKTDMVPALLQSYAQGMRKRRPSRFHQLQEPRRTLELVAFMRYALLEHTDTLVRLLDRRVARLWGRASEEARRTREQGSATNLFVDGIRSALATASGSSEERLSAITSLLADLDAGRLKPKSIAARQRDILVGQIAQIRPLLKAYLALDLRSRETDRWTVLIKEWRQTFALELSGLSEAMCPPKSRAWAALAADRNSLKARQAAEAQTLWEIRQSLRRGSLYVPHSLSYRDKQMLFDTAGTTVRAPGSQRPLPEVLEQLFATMEVGLDHLDEAVWFEHLKIDGTKIHQHPLAPQEAPEELESIREELYASLPTVHLPELMMAIDSEIRFSWILLGREPADDQELLYVYAALLGHAMDLTAQRVSLMTPGLSVAGLTSALQLLEDGPAMRRANAAAVEFMHAHPVAAAWGDSKDCAADAMSLDVSRHVWVARTDPKRRTWSTASYVHTLGRHGIGYDQPITITQRQPGAAIEGALRQTLAPIQQIFTDTHGYTAWAMGLAKHVGYDLCPRLKSFPDRRLHVPRGNRITIPECLKDVVLADISVEDIKNGWAEFSSVCDAVAAGRISAVLACERFGSASRGEKAYKAGHAYGLLLRTLHLCDTLTLEEFRRETLRALNHNERTHALQRQIRHDGSGSRRGRRTEELIAQSGALALVTNLVMAWNTHQIQATLDRWRAQGREIDPHILHHITPMGFEGINFGGILVFPLERYRSRLLPSSPPPPTTMVA